MILIFVLISLTVYLIVVENVKKRELNAKLKNIPGTNSAYPILGDVHVWSITKWSILEKMKHFVEVIRKYPTTLKVWFGPKVVIIINNPDDIKTVLSSPHCTDKSSIYRLSIGGDGLFVVNGNKWKNQRRRLNPTFNSRVLKTYENEFNQFGRNIVVALKEHASNGNEFDITPTLGHYITDLITRTIYGSAHHTFELSKHCYELAERLMMFWGERIAQIYFNFFMVVVRKIFRIPSEDKKLNKELRCGLQPIFDRKVEEYHNKVKFQKIVGSNNDMNQEHFLEKLTRLRFEGAIDMSEYRHTSMTMFMAGIETTTRSLSIIILMLALHENYQQEAYEEICTIFEMNGDNDIDISKLNELDLVDRIIKETLRIFPIVPFVGRTPTRDIPIKEGIIPAGTDILISLITIQQSPHIWGEDASKFNPDHFLPEAVANHPKCSYIPFSYGPRNCIGYKFAQISIYIAIIYLLRNYRFKTTLKVDDVKFGYGLTTYLLNDYVVSVQPRNVNQNGHCQLIA